MNTSGTSNEITYLRLDFRGCEYNASLDESIAKEFSSDSFTPIVRGETMLAAGSSLIVDIIMSLAPDVAASAIYDAFKNLVLRIRSASNEALSHGCDLGRTTIEAINCDYVIRTNCNADVFAEDVDLNELILQMNELRESEAAEGRYINKIEAPCSIDSRAGFEVITDSVGNYSLWLLSYREGERWPNCLYDAVNKVFFPMLDHEKIANAIEVQDAFWHPKR